MSSNSSVGFLLPFSKDYGFAADINDWTVELWNVNGNSNWLYLSLDEWTISKITSNTNLAFLIANTGYINIGNGVTKSFAIRPCFYLDSNITYVRGIGTQSDPYRIGI